MLVKKGEGLANRTIREHYNNFGYFKNYINRELLADEMTTELFMCWITFMREEMDYSPMTINIRVRTMRAFLRYCYEDQAWISEPIHKRFKPIKAPIDVVEAFTVEEYLRNEGASRTGRGYRFIQYRSDTYRMTKSVLLLFDQSVVLPPKYSFAIKLFQIIDCSFAVCSKYDVNIYIKTTSNYIIA